MPSWFARWKPTPSLSSTPPEFPPLDGHRLFVDAQNTGFLEVIEPPGWIRSFSNGFHLPAFFWGVKMEPLENHYILDIA